MFLLSGRRRVVVGRLRFEDYLSRMIGLEREVSKKAR